MISELVLGEPCNVPRRKPLNGSASESKGDRLYIERIRRATNWDSEHGFPTASTRRRNVDRNPSVGANGIVLFPRPDDVPVGRCCEKSNVLSESRSRHMKTICTARHHEVHEQGCANCCLGARDCHFRHFLSKLTVLVRPREYRREGMASLRPCGTRALFAVYPPLMRPLPCLWTCASHVCML